MKSNDDNHVTVTHTPWRQHQNTRLQTTLYNVATAARNQTMIVAMLCYIQKYAKSLLYTYVHIISNLTQRAHAPRSRVNGESNADHHTDDEYIYMQCGLLYFETNKVSFGISRQQQGRLCVCRPMSRE